MIVGPDSWGSGWRKKAPSLLAPTAHVTVNPVSNERKVGSSLHSAPCHRGSQLLLAAIGSKLSTVSTETMLGNGQATRRNVLETFFLKGIQNST